MPYTYSAFIQYHDVSGRLASLTQTPTISAFRSSNGDPISSPSWSLIATGLYKISVSHNVLEPVIFRIIPHNDDQADFPDVIVMHEEVSQGMARHESLLAAKRYGWSVIVPAGADHEIFSAACISHDAQYMLAGAYNGRLYFTNNYGRSWSEVQPAGNLNKYWFSLSISYFGEYIFVAPNNPTLEDRLYLSRDFGETFVEVQPAGDVGKFWFSTAISWDGEILLAGCHGGLYISRNWGFNWTEVTPFDSIWMSVAMSYSGDILLAASMPHGRVYVSYNQGYNWGDLMPAGDVDLQLNSVAMCSDGVYMLVATKNTLYLSSDHGFTFEEISPSGSPGSEYFSCRISAWGSTMMVSEVNNEFTSFISTDFGKTWSMVPMPITRDIFTCSAISMDGLNILLGGMFFYKRLFYTANRGTGLLNLNVESGSGSWPTPAQIWTHHKRTLTMSAIEVFDAVSGSTISALRGNTWAIEVHDLTLSSNLIQFAVKQKPVNVHLKPSLAPPPADPSDDKSLIFIDSTTGLLYLNAKPADPSHGSLVYAGTTLTINLSSEATSQLTPGLYIFGIQSIDPSGNVTESYIGNFTILADVVRSIT